MIFELAKKYYPDKWNKAMIRNLVDKGKLTELQYKEITGEDYEE